MLGKKLTKRLRRAAYEQFVLKQCSEIWRGCLTRVRKSGLDSMHAAMEATAHVLHRRRRRGESSTIGLTEKSTTKSIEFIANINNMIAALEPEEGWPDDSIEQRLLEQEEFLKCASPHLIPDLAKIVHDYI